MDHLKGRDSNSRLQRSINKYGISNFEFVIYYFDIDPSVILTDIETVFIKSFPFENLYNYKKNKEANSLLGYKHTIEAIEKMKLRYKDKSNHPMLGKTHTSFALSKKSKPGNLNPMFGKIHSIESKLKLSLAKSKISIICFPFPFPFPCCLFVVFILICLCLGAPFAFHFVLIFTSLAFELPFAFHFISNANAKEAKLAFVFILV
jgi:hypothetical protein